MLDDLSLFVTLVESGSFAKAAIRCDIYQSKLSRRLQTLEQNLGQILVDRSVKNTVVLTEAGIILYDKLHENITRINNDLGEEEAKIYRKCHSHGSTDQFQSLFHQSNHRRR